MRIRIALTTAVAVISVPVILLTLFSGTPAASARNSRHVAGTRREVTREVTKVHAQATTKVPMEPTSYAQAVKQAKLLAFYEAVEKHTVETYLQKVAADRKFLAAIAAQRARDRRASASRRSGPRRGPGRGRRGCCSCGRGRHTGARPAAPAPAPAAGGSDGTSTDTA